jgi:hypothetical protein
MTTRLLRTLSALAGLTLCACSSSSSPVILVAPTPTPASITVQCCTWTFFDPQTLYASATGHYSDGTTPNLTTVVAWQSSNPSVAAIVGPCSLTMVANPCGNGTTVITATYQGVAGSALLKLPLDIGPGC